MRIYDPLIWWYRSHSDTACAQGWDLFECTSEDHSPIELQRVDEGATDGSHPFEADVDAWTFVVTRAQAGDIACASALHLLALEAPEEWADIMGYWRVASGLVVV
jgi:hypothetical protein